MPVEEGASQFLVPSPILFFDAESKSTKIQNFLWLLGGGGGGGDPVFDAQCKIC